MNTNQIDGFSLFKAGFVLGLSFTLASVMMNTYLDAAAKIVTRYAQQRKRGV